jgi:hypothetical protein
MAHGERMQSASNEHVGFAGRDICDFTYMDIEEQEVDQMLPIAFDYWVGK